MAPSPRRQRVFALLAILVPLFAFGTLELGLRAGGYKGDLSLFVYPPGVDPKYLGVNQRLAVRYFVKLRALPTPPSDLFLQVKPAHGFRVFVLGESSAAGFPYGYNGTFSRVLRDALQDVMPGDTVEVVNLGLAAITSYVLFDELAEILDQKPDAVVIYAGHNEFYGALGAGSTETLGAWPAFVRTYLRLQRLKTVLLAREAATGLARRLGALGGASADSTRSLMQQMVGEELIPLDSPTYHRGVKQFRDNLRAILGALHAAHVPVFIGSLTSNLRDQPPFRSVSSPAQPPADRVFQEAQRARASGNRVEARRLFEQARDLDALRFRAPSEFNAIIRAVARETGAYYVPVDEAFAAAAPDGLPGSELFWEHLHPNQKGYHLMGRVFFEAMGRAGFLGRTVDTTRLRGWPAYLAGMELSEFDQRFAWHQIHSIMTSWPFVTREDPAGYPRTYRPTSTADSAAFDVAILHRVAWPQAKANLAAYYRSRGQLQPALAEYLGMMRDQPQNATIPVYAADLFMAVSDFRGARPLLERAYAIQRSAFTCYALGHLEVETKHPQRAIQLLEQAQQFSPDVPLVLFELSRAYALHREGTQARAYADRLAAIEPHFPDLDSWRAELATIPD